MKLSLVIEYILARKRIHPAVAIVIYFEFANLLKRFLCRGVEEELTASAHKTYQHSKEKK